jgi:hypothetical protein
MNLRWGGHWGGGGVSSRRHAPRRRRRPGGNWSDPYTTGGFFIVWVEDKYDKDWGYKLNMGMKDRNFDYAAFIQQTFGRTTDALWAEYQADISH